MWQQPCLAHAHQVTETKVTIQNLVHLTFARELAIGLIWTPTKSLGLTFDEEPVRTRDADPRQTVTNAGCFLSELLCGGVKYWTLEISTKSVSKAMFAAMCSAIAAISDPISLTFSIKTIDADSWSWLAYTVCCGASAVSRLKIWKATLTNSDISNIEAVLKDRYPRLKRDELQSRSIAYDHPQYDFVDVQKRTEVWLGGLDVAWDVSFVLSRSYRCRAYFRGTDDVEVVIPGYGICKTKLVYGVSRVLEQMNTRKHSSCGTRSLYLGFVAIESDPLAVDLLALFGRNLQSLSLSTSMDTNDPSLDLSMLSAACPQLTQLYTLRVAVIISAHNESLRQWPLTKLIVRITGKLSNLTLCLWNPKFRMARELVELGISILQDRGFDYSEINDLESLDEEFLPMTKKKFPIQLKTAMISVVCNAHFTTDGPKAIHRVDPYILSQIFIFAATPQQRSVRYYYCSSVNRNS